MLHASLCWLVGAAAAGGPQVLRSTAAQCCRVPGRLSTEAAASPGAAGTPGAAGGSPGERRTAAARAGCGKGALASRRGPPCRVHASQGCRVKSQSRRNRSAPAHPPQAALRTPAGAARRRPCRHAAAVRHRRHTAAEQRGGGQLSWHGGPLRADQLPFAHRPHLQPASKRSTPSTTGCVVMARCCWPVHHTRRRPSPGPLPTLDRAPASQALTGGGCCGG